MYRRETKESGFLNITNKTATLPFREIMKLVVSEAFFMHRTYRLIK